jgi:hypothetical protein
MTTTVSSSLRSDLNIAAKVIESSNEPQDGFGTIASGEVIGPQILVFDTVFEHVPDGGEHGGGDREDGFLGATPAAQTQELGLQVAVFHPHRGPGRSDERGFQPRGAFASAGGTALAGTLVISRAHRRPRKGVFTETCQK